MKLARTLAIPATAALLVVCYRPLVAAVGAAAPVEMWKLTGRDVTPDQGADAPRHVGSLQKPWVLEAWAETHAEAALPVVACGRGSGCWTPAGHGTLGLRRATAVSCNVYFRSLAAETPAWKLRETLTRAGFWVDAEPTADSAIGLPSGGSPSTTIRRLLLAYARLVTTPWLVHEDARRQWLDGMSDSARIGTASAIPLLGLLAKTGTVPGLRPWQVSGWALAIDPSGASGRVAFLRDGSGAKAAEALGRVLGSESSPGAAVRVSTPARARSSREKGTSPPALAMRPLPETVRVLLLPALQPDSVHARNIGTAAVERTKAFVDGKAAAGWVGAGAEVELLPGDTLGAGTWELRLPRYGLVRRVEGSIEAREASPGRGALRLVLVTPLRAYVDGVIRGELAPAQAARVPALGTATLRFLAHGARHGTEDVCDLSHCARFVGLGPDVEWPAPDRARLLATATPAIDDATWEAVSRAWREDGPDLWSAHCGGEPLSARAVWGRGSLRAEPCPRHSGRQASGWIRVLPGAVLDTALQGHVTALEAVELEGVRLARVEVDGDERFLLYDELHAALAARLGWDALPSPPDRYEPLTDGWRAVGRGSGHRVGLCLAE